MYIYAPFNIGREAYRQGSPKISNPYSVGSSDYKEWNNGFECESLSNSNLHKIPDDLLDLYFTICKYIKDIEFSEKMEREFLSSIRFESNLETVVPSFLLQLINHKHGLKATVSDVIPEVNMFLINLEFLYKEWISTGIPNIEKFEEIYREAKKLSDDASSYGYPMGRINAHDLALFPSKASTAYDVINIAAYNAGTILDIDRDEFMKLQLQILLELIKSA